MQEVRENLHGRREVERDGSQKENALPKVFKHAGAEANRAVLRRYREEELTK